MMIRIIFIFIFLLIISEGCKKDNNEVVKNLTEIEVGEYENMIINNYDTTLIGDYNNSKNFKLDIDNDGDDDIMFVSELWGSPAIGMHPKTMIVCLKKQAKLYGIHTNDTSFLNINTRIVVGANNTIEVYKYYNYTCNRIDDSDSVLKVIPVFKLLLLNRGDVLHANDVYNSDTLVLTNDGYGFYPVISQEVNDTLYYEYKYYYNNCNVFPLDKIKYIGVLLGDKLAWIKISIFNKYKILILDSGIQK